MTTPSLPADQLEAQKLAPWPDVAAWKPPCPRRIILTLSSALAYWRFAEVPIAVVMLVIACVVYLVCGWLHRRFGW